MAGGLDKDEWRNGWVNGLVGVAVVGTVVAGEVSRVGDPRELFCGNTWRLGFRRSLALTLGNFSLR